MSEYDKIRSKFPKKPITQSNIVESIRIVRASNFSCHEYDWEILGAAMSLIELLGTNEHQLKQTLELIAASEPDTSATWLIAKAREALEVDNG